MSWAGAEFARIMEAVEFVRAARSAGIGKSTGAPELAKSASAPRVGIILGSGLGGIADKLTNPIAIPYRDIPHFHETKIEGHAGKLVFGDFEGVPVVMLQGRFHLYEGYPIADVALPTRLLCILGIHTLILTNAAGGVNTRFHPGDLMLIEDQINFMGDNPLRGPNIPELGTRFPDLTEAYSKKCLEILKECATKLAIPIRTGVYAGLLGPSFETPAEIRMLRTMGADAVGMSTVPEAIVANHMGVRVAGISAICNLAAGLSPLKLTHQEVLESANIGAGRVVSLLEAAIPLLANAKKKS